MSIQKKKLLLEILRLGLLEIRLIASNAGDQDCKRINVLANILHNVPRFILNDEGFDFELLNDELRKYQNCYKGGLDFIKIIEEIKN